MSGARKCARCRASIGTSRDWAWPRAPMDWIRCGRSSPRRDGTCADDGILVVEVGNTEDGAAARLSRAAVCLAGDCDGRRRRVFAAGAGSDAATSRTKDKRVAGNTFGRVFTVTSFGESHGPALGCVVDGCPPGLALMRGGPASRCRSPPPGHLAVHQPAPRARYGAHPVGRVRRQDHRHADRRSWSRTKISARATTRRSRIAFVPDTRTTPTSRSTAFATIAAAAAPRRARP